MNNNPSVFQKSRVPLYLQVAGLMRKKIESQAWPFGKQIPTLGELEKEYQVSRITLRASLAQLEEQEIIRRSRGLGTFVVKDLSQQRWFKMPTNFDDLVETVSNLKTHLLAIEQDELPLIPAFAFGDMAPAYRRLRRVHFRNDVPYCLIEIYLAKDIFALDPDAFSNSPIIPKLASLPDLKITQARQIMRVTVSDEDTVAHLDIGVGDPIVDVCRALLDQDERLVYYAHIQYPAHMVQLEIDLMRGALQPKKSRPRKKTDESLFRKQT